MMVIFHWSNEVVHEGLNLQSIGEFLTEQGVWSCWNADYQCDKNVCDKVAKVVRLAIVISRLKINILSDQWDKNSNTSNKEENVHDKVSK